MKKTRFSEEQTVKILREADSAPVVEVTKKHGISELKKLIAERDLEIEVMKEVAAKKW
jgi:putative transposase